MKDVFDEVSGEQPESQSQGEQQQPNPAETQGEGAANGAPPATENTEKHVPLAALEAERKGRQDWKEKAIRAEAELEQLKKPQQQQQREMDPMEAQSLRLENVLLNASERAARKEYGAEVVDRAFERFQAEVQKNPSLGNQVRNSADPWDELVKQGQKLLALDEIGIDPVAYRKKVADELRAESQQSQQPPAQKLPNSLAAARSAGSTGSTWTGPVPIDSLFTN